MTNATPVRRIAAPDDVFSNAHSPIEAANHRNGLARHPAADADDNFLQVNEYLLPRDE